LRYISTYSSTPGLDGGSGQLHDSSTLVWGKNSRHTFGRRLDGSQSRYRRGSEEKMSLPAIVTVLQCRKQY
jgi:hypothetical protein